MRCDGHRLAPGEDCEPLVDEEGDARGDGALGQIGHGPSVSVRRSVAGRRGARPVGAEPVPAASLRAVDRRRLAGLALIVVSAFGFGSGTVLSKPIYATGLDWLQLLAWRFTIGARSPGRGFWSRRPRRCGLPDGHAPGRSSRPSRRLVHGQCRDVLRRVSRLCPRSLAGVLVYLYPAIVAVLSVRFATRLSGRRPWFALGIALVGVVLAFGGIDLATPPPLAGIALGARVSPDLRRLDHPVGPSRW